jgi:hypothetical protein
MKTVSLNITSHIQNTHGPSSKTIRYSNTLSKIIYSVFCVAVLLIHRFMQQLEDALNVSLCGHFLVMLAAMCFSAFSVVTVQYENFC